MSRLTYFKPGILKLRVSRFGLIASSRSEQHYGKLVCAPTYHLPGLDLVGARTRTGPKKVSASLLMSRPVVGTTHRFKGGWPFSRTLIESGNESRDSHGCA